MGKRKLGKLLSNIGRTIAVISALLAIVKVIPTNGMLQWGALIIGILFILIGEKIKVDN